MDTPNGLVYQNELPFERDAVQRIDGKWRFVKLRRAPVDVVAEDSTREAVWRMANALAEMPVWEEHYEGMQMVNCIPPKGVYRHPQTCFLVTDGTPRPSKTAPPEPDSHVRMKTVPETAPDTPRSAGWAEEQPSDWKVRVKKIVKL